MEGGGGSELPDCYHIRTRDRKHFEFKQSQKIEKKS